MTVELCKHDRATPATSDPTRRLDRSARFSLVGVATILLLSAGVAKGQGSERLAYNNPGLTVDLSVGLWAWPIPTDYDRDGLNDLLVVCPDKPFNGVWFFRNTATDPARPLFEPPVRVAEAQENVTPSYVNGQLRVLVPGAELRDFPTPGYPHLRKLTPAGGPPKFERKVRTDQWKLVDYDGDGLLDLVIAVEDWGDYGWDNAYDAEGNWTRGPLHGLVYVCRNNGRDNDHPRYGKPVPLEAGGRPIDTYGRPSPNFADFRGTGKLDLICGSFLDGFTWFENVGTREQPRYADGRPLATDGRPVRMDLQMIIPVAFDWDRDGAMDLIVGDEDGRVAWVRNTGRVVEGMPEFDPPAYFRQRAGDVKFGALATPVGFDWDGDGLEDILCGNSAGYVGFIKNLGGDPPRLAEPVKLATTDGKVIRIQAGANGSIQGPAEAKWGYTTFSVADWDHDRLPDLVANSIWGEVVLFRNVGTRQAPQLAPAVPVEVEWPGLAPKPSWNWWTPKGQQLVTQWRTTPVVVDWTGDGLNDLVMLDHEGFLALFERVRRNGLLKLLPGRRVFLDPNGQPMHLSAGDAGRSGRRKLCVADWDGDGRLDLLIDSQNVNLFRNLGTADGLTTFRDLGPLDDRVLAGHDTSPTVVHWRADDVPDLLIGAEDGRLYRVRNPRTK